MPVPNPNTTVRSIAKVDNIPQPRVRPLHAVASARMPLTLSQEISLVLRAGDYSAQSSQFTLRADASRPESPLASSTVGALASRGQQDFRELGRLPLSDFLLLLQTEQSALLAEVHWQDSTTIVFLLTEADSLESGAEVRPVARFAWSSDEPPQVALLHDQELGENSPMAKTPDDPRVATGIRGLFATVGLWAERSDLLVPHDGQGVHVNAGSSRVERVSVKQRSMIVYRPKRSDMPAEASACPRDTPPFAEMRRADRPVHHSGCRTYRPEALTGLPQGSANREFFLVTPKCYLAG